MFNFLSILQIKRRHWWNLDTSISKYKYKLHYIYFIFWEAHAGRVSCSTIKELIYSPRFIKRTKIIPLNKIQRREWYRKCTLNDYLHNSRARPAWAPFKVFNLQSSNSVNTLSPWTYKGSLSNIARPEAPPSQNLWQKVFDLTVPVANPPHSKTFVE